MLTVCVYQPDVMQFTVCFFVSLPWTLLCQCCLTDDQFDCLHLFVIQFLLACASGLAERLLSHCHVFIVCVTHAAHAVVLACLRVWPG